MTRERNDLSTNRRTVLASLAAGGAAGLAGCSTLTGDPPVGAAVAAERITFEGLPHTALGDADLHVETDDLVVSNVDGEGDDGVHVDFGSVGAAGVSLAPVDLGTEGHRFEVSGTGTVGGEPGRSIGAVSLRSTGDAIEAVADYSDVGSRDVRVEVLDGGELVGRTVVPGGDVVVTVEPGPEGLPLLTGCDKDIFPDPPLPCYRPDWDRIGLFVAADGTEMAGDRLRLLADDPDTSLDNIQSFSLTAAGVSRFRVERESIGVFGNDHGAVGEATLDAQYPDSRLTVGNLGTDGDDGVRVAGEGASQWSYTAAGDLREGGVHEMRLVGSGPRVDNEPAGGLRLTGTSEGAELTADFAGTDALVVRGYRDGVLVHETKVAGGVTTSGVQPAALPIGAVIGGIILCCVEASAEWDTGDDGGCSYSVGFDCDCLSGIVSFDFPDGETHEVDRVETAPAEPGTEFTSLDSATVLGQDVEPFTVTSETLQ